MIFDYQNLFSNEQSITVTATSTDVVATSINVGEGEPIFLSAHVVEPFVGLTSLDIQLQTADAPTGTWKTIQSSGPVLRADLNASKLVNLGSVPPRSKKYLRINYVVAGTATAGKLTAGLVWGKQTNNVG